MIVVLPDHTLLKTVQIHIIPLLTKQAKLNHDLRFSAHSIKYDRQYCLHLDNFSSRGYLAIENNEFTSLF